jgi:hypothetical protein
MTFFIIWNCMIFVEESSTDICQATLCWIISE